MSRNRPSSHRRRKMREEREKARQFSAKREKEDEQLIARAATRGPSRAKAPKTPKDKPTSNGKDTDSVPRFYKCNHRRLPDRLYYRRIERTDHRYLGFERRINALLDGMIAKGCADLDARERRDSAERSHFKLKVERRLDQMHRDLDFGTNRLFRLEKKVKDLTINLNEAMLVIGDLQEDAARERRRRRKKQNRAEAEIEMDEEFLDLEQSLGL
ncbi:hypothetical protein NW762_006649 [Fusarium torreyae]|uniref:Uncharacterized protein n=1 Tax=Fusarium torreyae TaxID=1237075 RepID=A0A9W8S0V3_9HYPO|nr:hypothetical protein NW762_006649 [Fusarium torreyae]